MLPSYSKFGLKGITTLEETFKAVAEETKIRIRIKYKKIF